MSLVREHINFERNIDPLDAMNVGIKSWKRLKDGDILLCIKNLDPKRFHIDKNNIMFAPSYYAIVFNKRIYDQSLVIDLAPLTNDISIVRKRHNDPKSTFFTIEVFADIKTWYEFFQIVQD